MDDLVLRIGRLAYRNPGWTPACGDASLARQPADLAPSAGGISTVLAAVHHATDTLTHIAVTDQRCVRQAAADHRLYIPTRLLPEDYDIPRPYSPAPRSRVTALLDGYRLAVKTCTAATAALDDLALAAGVPSRVLTAPPTPCLRSPDSADRQHSRTPAHRHGQSARQPCPCNPALSRRPSATSSSRNQPCCSAQPPSMRQPASCSPKQPPRHSTGPRATSQPAPCRHAGQAAFVGRDACLLAATTVGRLEAWPARTVRPARPCCAAVSRWSTRRWAGTLSLRQRVWLLGQARSPRDRGDGTAPQKARPIRTRQRHEVPCPYRVTCDAMTTVRSPGRNISSAGSTSVCAIAT